MFYYYYYYYDTFMLKVVMHNYNILNYLYY